jgi:phage terminase large subunit GpA-like protein
MSSSQAMKEVVWNRIQHLEFQDANSLIRRLWKTYFSPPRDMTVSEWADQYRKLDKKSSAAPGDWRTSRTPYLREIMDCFSLSSDVSEVVFVKGTQLGGSECGLNMLGYIISESPAPTMCTLPTIKLGERYVTQRLDPMVRASPVLAEKVVPARSREGVNTKTEKEFVGGLLIISGGNSAASLRSAPIKYRIIDELDACPKDVEGEGDPVSLTSARQDTFIDRKSFLNSTPTDEIDTMIWPEYETSDQRKYYVPCPHCGHEQTLEWGGVTENYGIKWHNDDPDTAMYLCISCGAYIEEHHKTMMLEKGRWSALYPDRPKRGYWLNSLYSPLGWLSWSKIVREYQEAKQKDEQGDSRKLKTWTNTRLASVWKGQSQKIAEDELKARAEPYSLRTVPEKALVLTAAVDTQQDRFDIVVDAWGRGEESWVVDHIQIYGNPGEEEVWKKLSDYLYSRFPHPRGKDLPISATAIDTGGWYTHDVYNWVRKQPEARCIFAIKGSNQAHDPIKGRSKLVDVNSRDGKVIPQGVKLWHVGVSVAKDTLFNRMKIIGEFPGQSFSKPGAMHFSHELKDEFYSQLTGEKKVQKVTSKGNKWMWIPIPGRRAEVLDCKVYSLFAANCLDLHRYTPEMWDRLEERLFPKQQSLLEDVEAQAIPDPVQEHRKQFQRPVTRLPRSKWGRR